MSRELTYVAVGVAAVGIDVGSLATLRELVHAPLAVATAVGLIAGLIWNYSAQRRLTFQSTVPLRHGLPRYLSLVVINYLTTVVLVTLAAHLGVGYLTGKGAAMALLTPVNFVLYRSWVFTGV